MTTPSEVVAAAMEMTSGSRLDRARAGVRAFGLFSQLDAGEKRDLAVLVAQRVAPELVPRIQAEGAVDLTEEQSRAVLDMVRRLDGDDLVELRDAVATPEARQQALASVGAAAATATGMDDVVAEPSAPGDRTPDEPAPAPTGTTAGGAILDEAAERTRMAMEVLERQVAELTEDLAAAEAARREAVAAAERAEQAVADARHEVEQERERAEQAEQATEAAREETRAAQERFRRFRDRTAATAAPTPTGGEPAPPVVLPVVPVTTSSAEADRLIARLQAVRTFEALGLVVTAAPSIAGMGAADRRRTVQALPDGWARRRALQRLVEAEALPPDEATDLLSLLSSPGNQVFVATTMLATGLVEVGDLAAALDPSAAARLDRRTSA